MRISRLQYILTWVSLAVLLICGILLMAVSWNSTVAPAIPAPPLMVILWITYVGLRDFSFYAGSKEGPPSVDG